MRTPKHHPVLETLTWLEEIGVTDPICHTAQSKLMPEAHHPPLPASAPSPTKSISLDGIQTLQELRTFMQGFSGCALKNTATHMVFSDGQEKAPIMVIGEAPGAEEDRLGKPFVGMSGQLLDKAFASIDLSRSKNIYISNIIPWRPPGNRQPSTEEITQCLPLIQKHVDLVSPKLIVCAGGVAIKSLLNTNLGISRLRGTWHPYSTGTQEIPLLATYHPAFLLRSPSRKRDVWHDLLKVKQKAQELNLPL